MTNQPTTYHCPVCRKPVKLWHGKTPRHGWSRGVTVIDGKKVPWILLAACRGSSQPAQAAPGEATAQSEEES